MRSSVERIVHVVLFEVGALALVAPVVARVSGASLIAAGGTSLVGSFVGTLTTYGWTLACDRRTPNRQRSVAIRMVQALGLELLFAIYSIPVFLWLGATINQAILLELAAIAFFGAYAWLYNTAFDAVVPLLRPALAVSTEDAADRPVTGAAS